MLDSLTTSNHRDFNQRYNNTFGWYIDKDKNKKILVLVNGVDEGRASFIDSSGTQYYSYADSGVQFEFIPVNRGFFNGKKDHVYLLERVPQRQWHRGISASNTLATMITTNNEDGSCRFRNCNIHFPVLTEVFEQQHSVNEKIDTLLKGKARCVALSRHFAIAGNNVMFFREKVGTFENNRIKLSNDLVSQEIMDVVKRQNLKLEVEVVSND